MTPPEAPLPIAQHWSWYEWTCNVQQKLYQDLSKETTRISDIQPRNTCAVFGTHPQADEAKRREWTARRRSKVGELHAEGRLADALLQYLYVVRSGRSNVLSTTKIIIFAGTL